MKHIPIFLLVATAAVVSSLTIQQHDLVHGATPEMIVQMIADQNTMKNEAMLFKAKYEVKIVKEVNFGMYASICTAIIEKFLNLFVSLAKAIDSIISAIRVQLRINISFKIGYQYDQAWESAGTKRCVYQITPTCSSGCDTRPQYLALWM